MTQKLTQEGYDKLAEELEYLKTEGRKEAAENIKEARSHGDLSENSEYDEAMNDQGRLEARIAEIENILKNSEIISEGEVGIHIGSVVVLLDVDEDEEEEYVILGENESAPDRSYISAESPVGKQLIGKGVGDEVSVEAPGGLVNFKVTKIVK
ncbi:MAG TPA: transcription elongation factor GreA [Ruminococcaceae bacterium]|nr:transcription elongation factor GreA [Oscillospiraceae bacterium]